MKAFLLAAGRGTRLRPLTNKIPKCLVLIRGRPLLHYWLRLCQRYGNGLVVDLGFDVLPGLCPVISVKLDDLDRKVIVPPMLVDFLRIISIIHIMMRVCITEWR